jgi:hypothetical protein
LRAEDRAAFLIALTKLAEVFGRQLTPIVIDAWFEDLEAYPIGLVVESLELYRATNNTGFMPVPGMIADLINARRPPRDTLALASAEHFPDPQEAKELLSKLRLIVQEGKGRPWAHPKTRRHAGPNRGDPGEAEGQPKPPPAIGEEI